MPNYVAANFYEQEHKAFCQNTSNSVPFDFPGGLLAYKLRVAATKVSVYEQAICKKSYGCIYTCLFKYISIC